MIDEEPDTGAGDYQRRAKKKGNSESSSLGKRIKLGGRRDPEKDGGKRRILIARRKCPFDEAAEAMSKKKPGNE